jgi:hypothetical protein
VGVERHDHRGVQLPDVLPVLLRFQTCAARQRRRTRRSWRRGPHALLPREQRLPRQLRHYGDTKLDGAKFWFGGDLGRRLFRRRNGLGTLTFDPSVTKEQREGIQKVMEHLYPVKWKSFTVMPDKPIEWNADKDRAVAKLDGGKAAEVVLKRYPATPTTPS